VIKLTSQDDQPNKVAQVNQAQLTSQDDQCNRADQVDQQDHGGKDDDQAQQLVKHVKIDHSEKDQGDWKRIMVTKIKSKMKRIQILLIMPSLQ